MFALPRYSLLLSVLRLVQEEKGEDGRCGALTERREGSERRVASTTRERGRSDNPKKKDECSKISNRATTPSHVSSALPLPMQQVPGYT